MWPWYLGADPPSASTRVLGPLLACFGAGVVAFDWFVLPTLGVAALVPMFEVLDLLGYALVLGGLVTYLGPFADG